jgi:hypothetical protein
MKIHIPADWRDAVPVVHIPRHPLWMDAYRGAWDLLGQALARDPPSRAPRRGRFETFRPLAQPGTGDQPDAEACIHYARYAFAALPLDAWLDHLCRTRLSPLHAWSEWSLFQVTGDSARLSQALPRLLGQYGRLQAVSQSAPYARIELCAQQALAAEHIARVARAVGASAEADAYEAEWQGLATLIDQRCWDGSLEFYTDCCEDGTHQPLKTVAGLWPFLAGIPSAERAERLAAHLAAPTEFWRLHAFASLSADHPRYSERGDGWRGAVWPLHNYAIIKGLERYGLHDLARRAADNHLTTISHVYKETQSLWDNYAPDYIEPGNSARPDAPGTGVSAVALLLETILGLTPDAPGSTLHWRPTLHETYSVEGLRIGSAVVSLYVEPEAANPARLRATLRTSASLTLHLSTPKRDERMVVQGETTIYI